MPLLPARCPNCNGELDVDNKYPRMTCSYCGTVFLVEQAIQQYNNTFNINAQSVNISGGESADTMVEGINKWINAGFFDKATSISYQMTKKYPGDYRGYWLLLVSETHSFTRLCYTIDSIKRKFDEVKVLAPSNKIAEYTPIVDAFIAHQEAKIQEENQIRENAAKERQDYINSEKSLTDYGKRIGREIVEWVNLKIDRKKYRFTIKEKLTGKITGVYCEDSHFVPHLIKEETYHKKYIVSISEKDKIIYETARKECEKQGVEIHYFLRRFEKSDKSFDDFEPQKIPESDSFYIQVVFSYKANI